VFFCDFNEDLAAAVRKGRAREFGRFREYAAPELRERIPDATRESTFRASRLDWESLAEPRHMLGLQLTRQLLQLRREVLFAAGPAQSLGREEASGSDAPDLLRIAWTLGDGSALTALAKLGPGRASGVRRPGGDLLISSRADADAMLADGHLPGWTTMWFRRSGA
jgi:1,4-alpha-glucan branching enzyme